MIICRFHGGLGNQIFQYAAGRALALRHQTSLIADARLFRTYRTHDYVIDRYQVEMTDSTVADLQGLRLPPESQNRVTRAVWALQNRGRLNYFLEQGLQYHPEFETLGDNVYLRGYFQCERYFRQITPQLRQELTRPEPVDDQNRRILDQIRSVNAVSLHLRRGNYVSDPKANKVHGTCPLGYYSEAAKHIAERTGRAPTFFVFSDSPEWVQENLKLPFEMRLMTHNSIDDPSMDLLLMSSCQHHVIANSSFSWWGAWLNPSPKKIVVACRQWFADPTKNDQDLVPESWVRLGPLQRARAAA